MSMRLIYTAVESQQTTLPTTDRTVEVGLTGATATAERQKIWMIVDNISPHLIQVLDEEGTVLGNIWPWSNKTIRLRPAGERRQAFFHWVSKLSTFAGTAQGIYYELTTVEPIPPAVSISS